VHPVIPLQQILIFQNLKKRSEVCDGYKDS
jgi:hypothetical protein